MRVDFIIIGAQKSGTTSLAHQLGQHPQISFCKKKEPNFFSMTDEWASKLDEYHHLFTASTGQLRGEASTSYTFLPEYPHTASRLFAYNPNLKLIYVMRQPVARIMSHYGHKYLRGKVNNSLETELLTNPVYVNRSRYGMQLKPYLELFGLEKMRLLIFEEFTANPVAMLRQTASFLEISPDEFETIDTTPRNTYVSVNKYPAVRFLAKTIFHRFPPSLRRPIQKNLLDRLKKKPKLSKEVAEKLWNSLEGDVREIEKLLQRRLDIWREGYR